MFRRRADRPKGAEAAIIAYKTRGANRPGMKPGLHSSGRALTHRHQSASSCMHSRANRPAIRSSSMMPTPP
ncbi:hypothetical protein D3C77_687080 [compost metagenome]